MANRGLSGKSSTRHPATPRNRAYIDGLGEAFDADAFPRSNATRDGTAVEVTWHVKRNAMESDHAPPFDAYP